MGLVGPEGKTVDFFPDLPMQYLDSTDSRSFSFMIEVPPKDDAL
jgi:hypothetical protein